MKMKIAMLINIVEVNVAPMASITSVPLTCKNWGRGRGKVTKYMYREPSNPGSCRVAYGKGLTKDLAFY